jgi:cysteine desulfuration protein SufE
MTIEEIKKEIIEEFSAFDQWLDKYEYLIELGRSMPMIDESAKCDDNLISGCQSRVWLDCKYSDNVLNFSADSDAIITKGIISLLIRVFDNQSPKDILSADLDFLDEIGLKDNLTPTRANGLLSMIKQIKAYALVYSEK